MGDGTEKFQGMALFLEGVIRGGGAFQNDPGGVNLIGLLGLGG